MKISIESAITLLHEAAFGTIATTSTQLPGYPYATAVPCVLDGCHRPVLFISALAEHTRNLLADPRSSLSVVKPGAANIQSAPRITMVGDAERFEPTPEFLGRYLRYQPEAEQYLELDFLFFRLNPKRARLIAGMGQMGWLDTADWDAIPVLSLEDEAALLKAASFEASPGIHLLGVDCFGIDYEMKGQRLRQLFPDAPLQPEKLAEVLARMVPKLP